MRLAAFAVFALSGCYHPSPPAGAPCASDNECPGEQQCIAGFCGGSASATDSGTIDVAIDSVVIPLCQQWHPKHFDPCAIPMPTGDLDLTAALSSYNFDTDTGVMKGKANTTISVTTMVVAQTAGPSVMLISARNFHLAANATLNVTGSRPLIIASWGTATIDGDIDVSASSVNPGPGGNGTICTGSVGVSGGAGTPAFGGGGGGFQGPGGRGGNLGGLGGAGVNVPDVVRGGCAGGLGGAGTGAASPRGAGGGAVQIAAFTSIALTGSIDAGGGGGNFGRANFGGGAGGGSGGFIGLDAPTLTVSGFLTANGGAGGGGASDTTAGSTGQDAHTNATAAAGGPGAGTSSVGACAAGGNGAAGATITGDPGGTSTCGGGGGGGSAGYIVFWAGSPPTTTGSTISPPASTGP